MRVCDVDVAVALAAAGQASDSEDEPPKTETETPKLLGQIRGGARWSFQASNDLAFPSPCIEGHHREVDSFWVLLSDDRHI